MGVWRWRALSRRGPTDVAAHDRQFPGGQERTIGSSGLSALATLFGVTRATTRGDILGDIYAGYI